MPKHIRIQQYIRCSNCGHDDNNGYKLLYTDKIYCCRCWKIMNTAPKPQYNNPYVHIIYVPMRN